MIGILLGLLGAGAIGATSLATVAAVSSGAIVGTGAVAAGIGGVALSQKLAKDSSAGAGLGGAFKHLIVFGNMVQKVGASSQQTIMGAIGSGGIGMKQQRRLQMESSAAMLGAMKPPPVRPVSRD